MIRLLKIGGSLITDKQKPYTARLDVIREIALAVKNAYGNQFMIGHGGGSFPHTSAKKYRTIEGFVNEESKLGLGIVHYDATALNQIFVHALHEAGVPAMSFHPSSFVLPFNDHPEKVFLDPLFEALRLGIVPVFYGDALVDGKKGCTIYSTEKLIALIAKHVKNAVIGMAEMVGGVYTADPLKNPDAELIPEINRENYREIFELLGGSHGIDVTGGMRHKVEELLKLAREGIPSVIFRGTPSNIERFLKGEPVEGTWIHW